MKHIKLLNTLAEKIDLQESELRRLHEVNGELADKLIAKSDRVIELEILNQELLEALKEIAKPIEGIALGNPWDFYKDLQIFAENAIKKATNQ